ncbi:transposase [Paludisphaera soli]|uniref:transposase n=1 Tax=Paludisphaera soli TaxID=2712865 RepID=UPI0013EDCBD5|nr:transposase [Paludisphaera soli]
MQPLLGQSTWGEEALLKRHRTAMAAKLADPAGIFVIDDTTFPKHEVPSVGVQRL